MEVGTRPALLVLGVDATLNLAGHARFSALPSLAKCLYGGTLPASRTAGLGRDMAQFALAGVCLAGVVAIIFSDWILAVIAGHIFVAITTEH